MLGLGWDQVDVAGGLWAFVGHSLGFSLCHAARDWPGRQILVWPAGGSLGSASVSTLWLFFHCLGWSGVGPVRLGEVHLNN